MLISSPLLGIAWSGLICLSVFANLDPFMVLRRQALQRPTDVNHLDDADVLALPEYVPLFAHLSLNSEMVKNLTALPASPRPDKHAFAPLNLAQV